MTPQAKLLITRSIPRFIQADQQQKELYINEVNKSLTHYKKENLTHDYALAFLEAAPIFLRYIQLYIK